jgi:hypothetical protein
MLLKETIAVNSEHHMIHIDKVCGQNAVFRI